MNKLNRYRWQWAAMAYRGADTAEMGYSALFTPREYRQMNEDMEKIAVEMGIDDNRPRQEMAKQMYRLNKEYTAFITPSLNRALYRSKVTFVVPADSSSRWSYANRHGDVVVVADGETMDDIRQRIEKSSMKLAGKIYLRSADITDGGSLAQLWDEPLMGDSRYVSLGMVPLTIAPQEMEKILNSLASVLTQKDNLAFRYIPDSVNGLPESVTVYAPAEMAQMLSRRGYNIYEEGCHIIDYGTQVNFVLAVKKMDKRG